MTPIVEHVIDGCLTPLFFEVAGPPFVLLPAQ
jgi:hypothetical protein